ncbi:MAG: methionyl-tRNA formyltransferase [Bdellovibrionaceae bacterium]|nr:methionyl-tRNA formyltransferase [Pseudobdellovibrionaceae bacterium]
MSRVRVCFLGTPEIAVTCLKAMLNDDHFEIVGVVTQPDRPAGRKLMLTPSPVKSLALAHDLRVISPDNINQDVILQEIESWSAEIAVVVAFGQILSTKFLELFRFGAVNVHASILPRWRGAAPIQRSLEAGETETGVALQKVVKKLDAGDLLGIRRLKVTDEMSAQDVYDQMGVLGADLLHIELMDFIRGNLAGIPQNHELATYAKKIDNLEARQDWTSPARLIFNRSRAFVFGPGIWVPFRDKKLKLHRVKPLAENFNVPAGHVAVVDREQLIIQTSDGALSLLEVQPESRNRMPISEFLKSANLSEGDLFA